MKIDRHGQARVLSQSEIARLFSEGLTNSRDRALFGICLFTAVRINEACTLRVVDVYGPKGAIHPEIVVRKANTKGRLATRTIPIIEDLRSILKTYKPPTNNIHLFPARRGSGHINPRSASNIFLAALRDVGIVGASTHSLRRTALTLMSNSGIPLRVIQEISGHKDLGELQKYLEVTDSQKRGAVSALSLLSPSNMNVGLKVIYSPKISENSRSKLTLGHYSVTARTSDRFQCPVDTVDSSSPSTGLLRER